MSLRPNTVIKITQVDNATFGKRNQSFTLDFCEFVEINKSWQNLTDTAKVRLPRNISVQDAQGTIYPFNKKDIYGTRTGGNASPLFMRGDIITISLGYYNDNMDGTETLEMPDAPQFEGYITKISNRNPIEIMCEDEMWKLKQIKAVNKIFKESDGYTVKKILQELLPSYTVTDGGADTFIGDFRTQNETVAQILERMRSEGNLYAYFRGKELRASSIVYYPQDLTTSAIFGFQENIVSDTLEYTRKEDLNIAVKAMANFITNGTGHNSDGTPKQKRKRIEVLVGKIDNAGQLGEISDEGKFQGDLITIHYSGVYTKEELIKRAKEYLPKFYYTGFRGAITTLAIPALTHGNVANIRDNIILERKGAYLIKQATYTSGLGGLFVKYLLHLRIDVGYTQQELNAGL